MTILNGQNLGILLLKLFTPPGLTGVVNWILDIMQLKRCENAVLSRIHSERIVVLKYLPGPKFLSNMYIGFCCISKF